jgi:hypothetical protein
LLEKTRGEAEEEERRLSMVQTEIAAAMGTLNDLVTHASACESQVIFSIRQMTLSQPYKFHSLYPSHELQNII